MHDGDLISRADALRAVEKINWLLLNDFYAHSDGTDLINEIPAVAAVPKAEAEALKEMIVFVGQHSTHMVSTSCPYCGKVVEMKVDK